MDIELDEIGQNKEFPIDRLIKMGYTPWSLNGIGTPIEISLRETAKNIGKEVTEEALQIAREEYIYPASCAKWNKELLEDSFNEASFGKVWADSPEELKGKIFASYSAYEKAVNDLILSSSAVQ